MPGKFENTCDWIYNHTKKAVAVSYNTTAGVTGKVFSTVDRVSGGKAKDVTGITVATVTTKAAVVPTLASLGFGSSGVVGGTTASWFMSLYGGSIPAGSVCAVLQSVSTGGFAVGLAYPAAAVGASYVAVRGAQRFWSGRGPPNSKL